MPVTFASDEWVDAFWSELRGDEEVRREGATWAHGPMLLLMEADGEAFPADVALRLDLHEGEARDLRRVDAGQAKATPFVIAGPYSRWKQVSQGRLDPVQGVMQGRLRFKGDLPTFVRHAELTASLLGCAMRVDTRFPDDEA